MSEALAAEKHEHHVLPRQHAERFARLGLDVNDARFGVLPDKEMHIQLHNVLKYNARWDEWPGRNRRATADDVLRFAEELAKDDGFPFKPWNHVCVLPAERSTHELCVEGRMSRVTWDGNVVERHRYDARNRRVKSGGTLQLYGLGGELLGEYLSAPAGLGRPRVVQERIYFAGQLVGTVAGDGSWSLPGTDRLGSLKQGARRYPFGDGNESYANDEYATCRKDHASAHYYAWNRYYSATWGRFSSPDPYVMSGGLTNPQGWNRYSYVANDPVNFYDPEGLVMVVPPSPPQLQPSWPSTPDNSFGLGWALGFYMDLGIVTMESDMGWPGGGSADPYRPPGHNGSLRALEREECYKLFGFKSSVNAQGAFNKVEFRAADLGRLKVIPGPDGTVQVAPGTPPPAETTGNAVTINTAYNWFTFRVDAVNVVTKAIQTFDYLSAVNNELGTKMTAADLAVLILLHEFRHTRHGGNAPPEKSSDFKEYNLPIYDKCIKK